MKKTLLITCILLLSIASYSNAGQTQIDSLESLLQTISANAESPDRSEEVEIVRKENINKINILNKLSLECIDKDILKAYRYVNQGLKLAEKTKYKEGISTSYNNLGLIYKSLEDYITTLKYFNRSVEVLRQIKSGKNPDKRWRIKQEIADSYNKIALLFENLDEYPDAFNYLFRSLSIRKELLEQTMLSENHRTSSVTERLKIFNVKQGIASCNNDIGIIYVKQAAIFREKGDTAQASLNYSIATRMFLESLKMNEEIGDKHGIAHSYNYTGLVYYNKGDMSCEKGDTAQANRDYSTALKNYFESLNIGKESGDKDGITDTYINIGLVYTKVGKYGDAIENIKKGLDIAEKTGLKKKIKTACRELANINDTLGDYKMANEYHKLYSAINITLLNEEKGIELKSVEAKHKFEIEEMNKKAKAEAEAIIKEKKDNRINFLGHTGSIIFIVLSFAVVFVYFSKIIPDYIANGIIFFAFLLIYIFIMKLIDPYLETLIGGNPAFQLAIYASVAVIIFPLYQFFKPKIIK